MLAPQGNSLTIRASRPVDNYSNKLLFRYLSFQYNRRSVAFPSVAPNGGMGRFSIRASYCTSIAKAGALTKFSYNLTNRTFVVGQ
jgi:hypothetical protein